MLLSAHIWDPNLLDPLYFKYNKWGHTQGTCQGKITCGYCAGDHDIRSCIKKDRLKCRNYKKKDHPTWARHQCMAYRARYQRREDLRIALLMREATWAQGNRTVLSRPTVNSCYGLGPLSGLCMPKAQSLAWSSDS